jgi:DNA (cytosine-5)-methyltransferase 1
MKNRKSIPVIDLFAGPGGLGEGFSALKDSENGYAFKIALSIEKDSMAHKTLELRSFFRQFRYKNKNIPEDYYNYLQGKIVRDKLFEKNAQEALLARKEVKLATLGDKNDDKKIDEWIKNVIGSETHMANPWDAYGKSMGSYRRATLPGIFAGRTFKKQGYRRLQARR